MAEELRTERVTTMMTPSEVKAIDDWSFGQRIRSRGEAIRRLIDIGLASQREWESVAKLTEAEAAEPASADES